jgi:ABC-type uncharacterized transport system permease subunit
MLLFSLFFTIFLILPLFWVFNSYKKTIKKLSQTFMEPFLEQKIISEQKAVEIATFFGIQIPIGTVGM